MSPFPSLALFRPHRLSLALATAFGTLALSGASPVRAQAVTAEAAADSAPAAASAAAAPGAAASSSTGSALPTVSVSGRSTTSEGTGSYTVRSTGAGTRMPLSPRETPQSLTVVGRQQMDEQNLDTLNEVMRQTPARTAGCFAT